MTGLIASDAHAAGVVAKYKTDYAVAPGGTVLKGNNLPAVETWTFYSDNTVSYVLNLSSGKTYNGSTSYASSTNGSYLYRISPSADFSGYNYFYKDGTSVYREKDGYKYYMTLVPTATETPKLPASSVIGSWVMDRWDVDGETYDRDQLWEIGGVKGTMVFFKDSTVDYKYWAKNEIIADQIMLYSMTATGVSIYDDAYELVNGELVSYNGAATIYYVRDTGTASEPTVIPEPTVTPEPTATPEPVLNNVFIGEWELDRTYLDGEVLYWNELTAAGTDRKYIFYKNGTFDTIYVSNGEENTFTFVYEAKGNYAAGNYTSFELMYNDELKAITDTTKEYYVRKGNRVVHTPTPAPERKLESAWQLYKVDNNGPVLTANQLWGITGHYEKYRFYSDGTAEKMIWDGEEVLELTVPYEGDKWGYLLPDTNEYFIKMDENTLKRNLDGNIIYYYVRESEDNQLNTSPSSVGKWELDHVEMDGEITFYYDSLFEKELIEWYEFFDNGVAQYRAQWQLNEEKAPYTKSNEEYILLNRSLVQQGENLVYHRNNGVDYYFTPSGAEHLKEPAPTELPRLPGDVTDDGKVNIMDVIRLLKYVSGWDVEIARQNANVTGDSDINIMDVIRLLKYVSGWDVELA